MKAVIQRVTKASVEVDEDQVAVINLGLLVLLGIETEDTEEDAQWLSKKIANLRIFNDSENTMNCSLIDVQGDVIVVSQFTLHASTKKGNRPSYIKAAKPEIAIPLYEYFIEQIENEIGKSVQTGVFGVHMKVGLCNHGPVTIVIDTKRKE
ncbi:D-aminoacyl-tRNA deacylase [Paucihalobacter sp.]|uniref:D-aminoacyl-tRNA deacylase n=1 Tax=Paucihalobacter sp. TaxID=2850405 RepID=UPI002FDF396A